MKKLTKKEMREVKQSYAHIDMELNRNVKPPVSALIGEISVLFRIAVRSDATDISNARPSRMAILRYLGRHEEALQTDISNFAHMSGASVSVEISNMESLGLIERRKSDTDARAMYVSITDKGRAQLSELRSSLEAMDAAMLKDFSEEELVSVIGLLTKMRNNILCRIDYRPTESYTAQNIEKQTETTDIKGETI